jgi:hypothetical protein
MSDSQRNNSTWIIVAGIVAAVPLVACAVVGVAVLLVILFGVSPVPVMF